ncbi:hypothetical protein Pint_32958 [Pistacia integerrima]|uniref:Uncharacterized protein n=1 Tax=Pistacia integerrima TaxID=434235 RepID=A0ACC0X5D6_9ROSI|nr:hypothetical protein Pint_32958 [Pistacia integerrima]
MALSSFSSSNCSSILSASHFSRPNLFFSSNLSFFHSPVKLNNSVNYNYNKSVNILSASEKWRANVSFSFPFFLKKGKDVKLLKQKLLEAIAPLDRGAEATPEDQQRVDELSRKLEAVNPTEEPLKSDLLNGKWELIYTTSKSILQTQRPKFLRSTTNYQAINVDTLRAQNMESWPFFNQVTADLTPLNARKVAVKFDNFKIASLVSVLRINYILCNSYMLLTVPGVMSCGQPQDIEEVICIGAELLDKIIPIKAPGRARGELEITYLDEELRLVPLPFHDVYGISVHCAVPSGNAQYLWAKSLGF